MFNFRFKDYNGPGLLLALAAAIFIAAWLPPKHNPDGNFYYGVALLVSQGRFFESINGFYGPLLSWLMAPLISLGIPIGGAFRVVNLCALMFFLTGALRIARHLRVSPPVLQLTLLLLALHTVYTAFVLVSSDLLAAALAVWSWYFLIRSWAQPRNLAAAGVFAALAYYAKAPQLPIYIAVVGLLILSKTALGELRFWTALKSGALTVLVAVALALPWIASLSLKYGEPIISAQQLIMKYGLVVTTFAPQLPFQDELRASQQETAQLSATKTTGLFTGSSQFLKRSVIASAVPYLIQTSTGLFFGAIGIVFFLTLTAGGCLWALSRPRSSPFFQIALIAGVQVGAYLSLWGAYLRYLYPVLPLLYMIFLQAGVSLYSRLADPERRLPILGTASRLVLTNLVALLVLADIAWTSVAAIRRDWSATAADIVLYAAQLPALKESPGPFTGNVDSPYPPLIAYHDKKEFWNAIDLRLFDGCRRLAPQLRRWGVSRIIWFGSLPACLESLPGWRSAGTYAAGGKTFSILSPEAPAP